MSNDTKYNLTPEAISAGDEFANAVGLPTSGSNYKLPTFQGLLNAYQAKFREEFVYGVEKDCTLRPGWSIDKELSDDKKKEYYYFRTLDDLYQYAPKVIDGQSTASWLLKIPSFKVSFPPKRTIEQGLQQYLLNDSVGFVTALHDVLSSNSGVLVALRLSLSSGGWHNYDDYCTAVNSGTPQEREWLRGALAAGIKEGCVHVTAIWAVVPPIANGKFVCMSQVATEISVDAFDRVTMRTSISVDGAFSELDSGIRGVLDKHCRLVPIPRPGKLIEIKDVVETPAGSKLSHEALTWSKNPKGAHREFYPWVNQDLLEYFREYLQSDSNGLIMQGPPGTGKSTLLRTWVENNPAVTFIKVANSAVIHHPRFFTMLIDSLGGYGAIQRKEIQRKENRLVTTPAGTEELDGVEHALAHVARSMSNDSEGKVGRGLHSSIVQIDDAVVGQSGESKDNSGGAGGATGSLPAPLPQFIYPGVASHWHGFGQQPVPFFSSDDAPKQHVLILEDSSELLRCKSQGNHHLSQILNLLDGETAYNLKIIFTTNLDAEEIDEAAVRPGRCFDIFETTKLTFDQAKAARAAAGMNPDDLTQACSMTLAEATLPKPRPVVAGRVTSRFPISKSSIGFIG